jgi:hypothetical protein
MPLPSVAPWWVAAFFATAACASPRPPSPGGVAIPSLGGPILADGRSTPSAWAGARIVEQRGVTIRLGRAGGAIAIRTETADPSIATILVAAADRVWLLHASAALGTGEYRCQSEGGCARVRDFGWSCRDPSDNPEAVACREAFRTREGWLGNVDPQGGRVREFLIVPGRFSAEGSLRMVVTVLTLPEQAMGWPAVADETASVAVQQGALPEAARFSVGSWLEVPR